MDQELNEAEDRIIDLEMQLRMSRDCTTELRAEVERLQAENLELKQINEILVKGQTEDQPGPWVQRSFQALAAAKGTMGELERAIALIGEANEYLNTNKLTNIAHGSILHQKFRELLVGQTV